MRMRIWQSNTKSKKEAASTRPRAATEYTPVEVERLPKRTTVGLTGWFEGETAIVVVDFDEVRDVAAIEAYFPATRTARSGSGKGLHKYYQVCCTAETQPHNENHPPLTEIGAQMAAAIDTRGKGGIIFMPPTHFTDHPGPYEWIDSREPTVLTLTEYYRLLDGVIGAKLLITQDNRSIAIREEWVYVDQPMRRGFELIKDGTIDLHGARPNPEVAEFEYWAGLFREAISRGYDLQDLFLELAAHQPAFDEATTRQQLPYLHKSPPSRQFYEKLFPKRTCPEAWQDQHEIEFTDKFLQSFQREYQPRYEFRWVIENKEWRYYCDPNHVMAPAEFMDAIIIQWWQLAHPDDPLSARAMDLMLRKLKAITCTSLANYDKDTVYALLTQTLDAGKLIPNSPKNWTFRCLKRTIVPVENSKIQAFISDLRAATDDWEAILSYYAAIVQRIKLPYFLIFLGKPSAGKSPYCKLAEDLFAGWVGKVDFTKLGDPGGLATIWNNRVGIDSDVNMSYMNNATIAVLKKIYSDDGEISVRLLYQNPFDVKLDFSLICASNQLPKIPAGINASALYKRVYICQFDKALFYDDPVFTARMSDPAFHDMLFSYLCDYPVVNYRTVVDTDQFILRTERLWRHSAYPVLTYIEQHYVRSTDIDDYVLQQTIIRDVIPWLQEEGISLPANLGAEITEAVHQIGGSKCQREKSTAYIGIVSLAEVNLNRVTEEDTQRAAKTIDALFSTIKRDPPP